MIWNKFSKEIREFFELDPENFLKGDTAKNTYNGTIVRVFRQNWPNDDEKDPYLDLVKDEHTFGTNTYKGFTQATLRSIIYIREMEKYFDPSKVEYLLDFGPGYGNNARVWHTLFQTPNIIMCDLPELHPVSKYYLDKHGIEAKWIHSREIEKPPVKESLFFATHSLNECPLDVRSEICPWLSTFEHVYIVYNGEFFGVNNIEYFETLAKKLPHKTVDLTFNEATAKWSLIATRL